MFSTYAGSVASFCVKRKLLTICFLLFVLIMLQQNSEYDASNHLRSISKNIQALTRDNRMIENILKASYNPKYNGKTIFFLETKPSHEDIKIISLTAKQACSVEAAGKILSKFLLNNY